MRTEWTGGAGAAREELFGSEQYDAVKDLLYQDILALDVQRARDVGVAGYASVRRFAEEKVALNTLDDLRQVLPAAVVDDLKTLYDDVEDVDPMVALLEEPYEDGVVGKSFNFLQLDQMARLRTGNRYYWEHAEALFSDDQKAQLHKATPAALLCSNLPLKTVPKNPLLPVSESNPEVACADVERMDLKAWRPFKQNLEVEHKAEDVKSTGEDPELTKNQPPALKEKAESAKAKPAETLTETVYEDGDTEEVVVTVTQTVTSTLEEATRVSGEVVSSDDATVEAVAGEEPPIVVTRTVEVTEDAPIVVTSTVEVDAPVEVQTVEVTEEVPVTVTSTVEVTQVTPVEVTSTVEVTEDAATVKEEL